MTDLPLTSSAAARVRGLFRERAAVLTVWLGALVYAVVLSIESVSAHRDFVTGFDTALYDQLLWLLATGHEPFSTIVARPLLADHFQPGLALFVPLYWLGAGMSVLLVAQSVALAATGPALYALARAAGARPALAAIPAVLWLACPFVARLNLWEFRPTAFVSVLVVVSVLGAVRARPWLLGTTAIVALSMKEDVALVYVVLGAVLVVQGKRRLGGVVAAGSAAWLLLGWLVVRSGSGALDEFGRRFAGDRGDSMPQALVWMLQHPLATAGDIVRESLFYLVLLFVATGWLALLAPVWMLLALPTAAHNALSAYEPQHELGFHYHQLTMTGLFVAAALGVRRLESTGRALRLGAVAGIAVAALLAVVAGGWAHAQGTYDWTKGLRLPRESTRAVLALIPADAPVAASTHLLPHFSERVEAYPLPEPFIPLDTGSPLTEAEFADRARDVDYVAYREYDLPAEYSGGPETVLAMLEREGFAVIAREGRVTVYKRTRSSSRG